MAYDGTLKFDTKIITDGFRAGINSISDIASKGIKATAAILSGAVAAVGAIGTTAIRVGSSFEAGMSQVQAITGTVADRDLPDIIQKAEEMGLAFEEGASTTETAMSILAAKAKEMGASTKFTATESAEALNYMAMAGWKTTDMLDGIEGIMYLAAASGENLATTSDIVTDALTAFGMEAGDATQFADILAAASSNANTNVGMMGETFKYVAPLAGALKYSAEDTAVAIGLMANAGIKGGQAGTSLRAILTRLAKPTEESAMAMEALGLAITDSSGEMKPLSEILADMREGFAELTEDEKASYAAMLGGQEAMSGLLAIVNASDEDFEKLSGAIAGCSGAAEEMAEIMQDNLPGAFTILQSGLEGLGVSIYEGIQDPLKDVVSEAQAMVKELQEAFDEGGLDGLVSAFGGVLAQIAQRIAQEAPALVDTAVKLIFSFCESLKNAEGLGETGADLVASLVSGVLSSAGEMWSTAVVLFADFLSGMAEQLPQILATGKEAIVQFGQAVVDNAPSILSSAQTIVTTLFDGIMSSLPELTGAGVDILNRLAEGISGSLPELIPVAMNALMEFSASLRENAGLLVDAGLNLLMSLAQSLIDNLPVFIETVPTIVTNIAGIINDNAPKLLTTGIELIGKLAMGLIEAIPTLVANIPQIIEAVVSVFTAFNWLDLGKNIIKFIADGVKSLAKSLPNALKKIGTQAKEWLKNIDWKTLGKDIINFIVNGVKSLVTAIPELVKSIGHMAVEWFKSIDWLDLGINLVKGIIGGITGALDGLWDAVGDMCDGVLDGIKGFFGIHSPSTVMAEQGGYLVAGMVEGLGPLPEEAGNIFSETLEGVAQWGADMMQSAAESADSTARAVEGNFTDMSGSLGITMADTLANADLWGADMLQSASDMSNNTKAFVENSFTGMSGSLGGILADTLSGTDSWGSGMLRSATDMAVSATSFLKDSFLDMSAKLGGTLAETLAETGLWGGDMVGEAITAAQGFVDSVVGGVSSLPDMMTDIGSNIVSGIGSGISSGWGWLQDTVSGLAGSLFASAKKALGINSPSKVFADEVGRWIPPGIGEGMEEAMPDLERQIGEQLEHFAEKMQTAIEVESSSITVKSGVKAQYEAAKEYPVRENGSTGLSGNAWNEQPQQVINVNQPCRSPVEMGREIKRIWRELEFEDK